MSDLFEVSYAPHMTSSYTTRNIMQDVAIALIPASLFGIYNFGLRALLIILVSVLTCVVTEYLFLKVMKKPITPSDYSEVVTGILIALNLPVNVPLWIPVLGGVFAILVVKMLYGGIGQNFMNPALAARCFLLISFPAKMADFATQAVASNGGFLSKLHGGAISIDSVTSATPLAVLKDGGSVNMFDLFVGNINGTIGEVSALAILLGAGYLLARKIISLRIPLSYILTFVVFTLIFGGEGFDLSFTLNQVLSGGLLLAAFFMATDYSTSPGTPMGQIIFGVILGILTGIFRLFGASVEGVSYAIIICNLLAPIIERVTVPRPFGKERGYSGE